VPRQEVWEVPLSRYYDYVLYAYPTEDGIGVDVLRAWGQPGPSKRPLMSLRVRYEELSCGGELGLRPEGYRARIRNHGHSCFLCEIVIRSQFHTTYEPEA
jgi:hypothetical protein